MKFMFSERFQGLCESFENGLNRQLTEKEKEFIAWIVKREKEVKKQSQI